MLSACSSYFCGMFTGGMREASKGVVDVHGIEPQIFKTLLDFVYTGKKQASSQHISICLARGNFFFFLY